MHVNTQLVPAAEVADPVAAAPRISRNPWREAWKLAEVRWAALALGLFAVGAALQVAGAPTWAWWAFYLACYAAGGWAPALEGLKALRERTLDVDILMIVAALAALGIGHVFDGALLIVIFASSGALEAFVTRRTADSVNALLDLAPRSAVRRRADAVEERVPVSDLRIGDTVIVRPGELVGADGVVRTGVSDLDQATITGEPLPVTKGPGDEVFAGTLNGVGALEIEVRRDPSDSVVQRIVAMVEEASETKARTQLFVERVEEKYSVVVVGVTLALLAVPLLAGADFEPTLMRAMVFMIVASPCALVLATMPPLLAVIANAGRHGVLIRSAVALQALREVDLVAFDKTGTLTRGVPEVVDVVAVADLDPQRVMSLAAAVEQGSEHPIARAVLRAAADVAPEAVEDFVAVPGRGVRARVGGRVVEVVAPREVASLRSEAADVVTSAEARGQGAVVVVVDEVVVGVVVVSDVVREGARAAVGALGRVVGESALVTGDAAGPAGAVAAEAGVGEVHAAQLPQDKAERVAAWQRDGRRVLFVGDGINDAPAMATAHVGVAMARSGSDLAVETADVILVRDDLGAVAPAVAAARRAHRVMVANLVFAASVIVVLVTWGIVGELPLALGVAGHEGSTVVVALNGLRLLRRSAWRI